MVGVPRLSPAELVSGWPDVATDDPAGEVARRVALELRSAIDSHGLRAFADQVDLNHSTLLGVLAGRTWPSVQLIARMEAVLARPVWPHR
ncbi:hypothetical protein [Microbacterium sp. Leaf320]|uniref:hypothetical protein n=1 Tax=Microbacterium sp. Leaf320 TaxID=1736334 RepID=UPI0012FB2EA7|nr:hypothetical protein [Microbacterium sp. Leaf320]